MEYATIVVVIASRWFVFLYFVKAAKAIRSYHSTYTIRSTLPVTIFKITFFTMCRRAKNIIGNFFGLYIKGQKMLRKHDLHFCQMNNETRFPVVFRYNAVNYRSFCRARPSLAPPKFSWKKEPKFKANTTKKKYHLNFSRTICNTNEKDHFHKDTISFLCLKGCLQLAKMYRQY